ncbi:MAG: TolB family protein [Candidatus Latescibacterota bacterium]|jgi:Tol biopolymer transport system component
MECEAVTSYDAKTGRAVSQLTNNKRRSVHGYYDLPPWSPVDGRIAFSRMDTPKSKTGDICVMDADGNNLKVVASSRVMSPNDGAMAQWAADGSRIYFKDREDHQRLIGWVNPDSGETGVHTGDLRMIRPIGHENAYHTHHNDYTHDDVVKLKDKHGVFAQDLNTGKSRQLATLSDCLALHPRRDEIANWHLFVKHTKWSPDGSRMMFVFTNEIHFDKLYGELPRVKDIYVVHADGSKLKRIGEFGNHPLWHPNGREILTNSPFDGSKSNKLVLTDVDTGVARLATPCMDGFGHPSFSPNGKYIVVDVVNNKTKEARLELVNVEAHTTQTLIETTVVDHTHDGTHMHPVWRQDGSQILYDSDASGYSQLCVLDL